jgi:hypothetical protein
MDTKPPRDVVPIDDVDTHALLKDRPKTPGGLPKGLLWVPHDTGRLGYAAARRRRQMERAAKKAKDW